MAPIRSSVEIARKPEDVFAYLDDLSRHPEWQDSLVSVQIETPGPTRVGTRIKQTRQTPGGKRTMTVGVTAHDPPRRVAFRGLDGPIRPTGEVILEAVDDGARTRLTQELDLVGHRLGKLLVPLIRSQVRKEIPRNQEKLRANLEQPQPGASGAHLS
jgi:uncharacterized membrane protein